MSNVSITTEKNTVTVNGDTNQAINTSGNLSMSGSVGITINNAGGSESRPNNVALMYIIKL